MHRQEASIMIGQSALGWTFNPWIYCALAISFFNVFPEIGPNGFVALSMLAIGPTNYTE
jgi:hypothetical protein